MWGLLVVLCGLCFISIDCIVLRVRLPNGLLKKVDVDPSQSMMQLTDRLKDLGVSSNCTLCFPSGKSDVLSNLLRINGQIGDSGVKHGDLLTVASAFSPSDIRAENTRRVQIARERVQATVSSNPRRGIRLQRQAVSALSLIRVPANTGAVFDRISGMPGLGLLLGQRNNVTDKPNINGRVQTLATLSKTLQCDDVEAVVVIADNLYDIELTQVKERIEDIKSLASMLNLSILGCATSGDQGRGAAEVLMALEVLTSVTGLDSPPASFSIVRASRASAVEKSPRARLTLTSSGEVELEAFRVSDQAVQLWREGLVDRPKDWAKTDREVHLREPVLVGSEEVSSVDPVLLLVPASIALLKPTVGPPRFTHFFPSADKMMDPGTETEALKYLIRLLRNLRQGGAAAKEAAARMLDPHLLAYLQSALSEDQLRQLYLHCTECSPRSGVMPVALMGMLDLLRVGLELRTAAAAAADDTE